MAEDEDDNLDTTIRLPLSLVRRLDALLLYAKDRRLVGRSAHRNDLIRLMLDASATEMEKQRDGGKRG